ncbi:MAG: ComEC/Rec2 family competence protein [Elusimicrobiota bacterium]|nr:ComEC/Rec2 family competence protein [Elusimicrobiota bacterium]
MIIDCATKVATTRRDGLVHTADMFIQRLLQRICYAFIVGIALCMIFLPDFNATRPVLFNKFSVNTLLWILTGIFFTLGIHAVIKRNKAKQLTYLSAAFFLFGVARYFVAVDISSPSHITKHLDKSFNDRTVIRGTVIRDIDDRRNFAYVDIKPDELIPEPGKKPPQVIKLTGKTGYIRAKIYPSIGDYYYQMSYGDRVDFDSVVLPPRTLTNPAGFDYRRYLRARNVYGSIPSIRYPGQIKYLGGSQLGLYHKVVQFSFNLRKRLLLTVRKTMPYPESAFLGGVSLGLRGGVPQNIRYEFQATGVAHVLALSGLHVGFIAALLYVLARIFRLRRKIRFFVIASGLFIFTLLTGATPATQRAALMFSLWLFFGDILNWKLYGAAKLTIPLSAFIILVLNPLWLPDASFILSFMAVWSLVYLTPPIQRILIEKRNSPIHDFVTFPLFTVLFGMTVIMFFVGILKSVYIAKLIFPPIVSIKPLSTYIPNWFCVPQSKVLYQPQFVVLSLFLWIAGIIVARLYRLSDRDIIDDFWYSPVGKGLLEFSCSQLAIQLGMMWPLSAAYFYRFPIAGFYANFFAIPLIGLIVQLGWIAGSLDVAFGWIKLPFVLLSATTLGELLSLIINAFNWVLCQMFLGMAKSWGAFVPYPFTEMFTTKDFIVWYGLCVAFMYHERIFSIIRDIFVRFRQAVVVVVLIVCVIGILLALPKKERGRNLRIVFFDPGFGNAILLTTPEGKNILVDGGPPGAAGWNFGQATICPTFTKYKINSVDLAILTSLNSGNIGGLYYVVNTFPTKKLILPFEPEIFKRKMSYQEFLSFINDWQYLYNPYQTYPMKLYLGYYNFSKLFEKSAAELSYAKQGKILYQEGGGDGLKIISFTPFENKLDGSRDDFNNNFTTVLKIIYGKKSILLPTQIASEGQEKLVNIYGKELKSDVLLLPKNGNPADFQPKFIKTVSPEISICQYGWSYEPGYFTESELGRTIRNYKKLGFEVLLTSKRGAVIYETDGKISKHSTIISEAVGDIEEGVAEF